MAGPRTPLDKVLIPAVKNIVDTYGKISEYVDITYTDYDPVSGTSPVESTTTYTVKVTPPYPFDKMLVNGTTIQASDKKCLISAQNIQFTPKTGDRINFDENVPDLSGLPDTSPTAPVLTIYDIIGVWPIYSGEEPCAYELHLRNT